MRRLVAACLAAVSVGLAGCASTPDTDPLQATDRLSPATPARSPATSEPPQGTILSAPAAELSAYEPGSHTLAIATNSGLSLYDTRHPDQPPRGIELPSAPAHLRAEHGKLLTALPESNLVITIDPRTGERQSRRVPGGPVDATHAGNLLAVALRDQHSVTFLHGRARQATADGFRRPSRLFAVGDRVFVLDRLTTTVTPVNPRTGEKQAALRAGQGATNGVTDRYGRVLVTDTRSGEYLAFSTDPFVMKQRAPIPAAPYDIAYDRTRDLVWITLTETNEVAGYDVGAGQPKQRYRLPTVRQPNSVAVDPDSGEVYVTSATGDGIQVVKV